MPSMLDIGVGVAQGLEKATNNIYNISQARQKVERQKKIDDITFKQAKLEVDKLEDPERQKLEMDSLKAQNKVRETQAAKNEQAFKTELAKQKQNEAQSANAMALINALRAEGGGGGGQGDVMDLGKVDWEIDSSGKYKISSKKGKSERGTVLPPDPGFAERRAKGFFGLGGNKDIDEVTPKVIGNITSKKDLKDFIAEEDYLRENGVNTELVRDYHADKFGDMEDKGDELAELGISEEDLQSTMKVRNLTRKAVLEKLRKAKGNK